jgi:hypothetical protein
LNNEEVPALESANFKIDRLKKREEAIAVGDFGKIQEESAACKQTRPQVRRSRARELWPTGVELGN